MLNDLVLLDREMPLLADVLPDPVDRGRRLGLPRGRLTTPPARWKEIGASETGFRIFL
jgi:hypothetical protein